MRRSILATLILMSVIVLCPFSSLAADEEFLAQQAEQSGKLREAVTHYVSALQSVSEGSSKDQQLREKIISLVQKLTPPPAVPEEARRFAVRGKTAISEAKSTSDFEEAANEFKKALRLAPWWAESYFNLAVALEKAEQFNEAIRHLKFYLLATPEASDTEKVKEQIYSLEYKQEKAQKETIAKKAEEVGAARERKLFESLSGVWIWRRSSVSSVEYRLTLIGQDEFDLAPTRVLLSPPGVTPYLGEWQRFRGRVSGNQITGTAFRQGAIECSGIRQTRMSGQVLAEGRTLVLRHMALWGCNQDPNVIDEVRLTR